MNFNVNDNPLLVAPRPVRVTSAYPHHFTRSAQLRLAVPPSDPERMKISGESENIDESKHPSRIHSATSSDKESHSPRASPRPSLPSEALEEFLSILRPAIFPPSSPVLLSRRNGAVSIGVSYKSRSKLDTSHSKGEQQISCLLEELDVDKQTPTYSPEPITETFTGNWDIYGSEITSRWHAQVLASPISRMHTRNPFPRYASQDLALSVHSRSSPAMTLVPLSPAAVPLPSPSPDEMLKVF